MVKGEGYRIRNKKHIHDYTFIDYILVYDISNDNAKEQNQTRRRAYENNLIKSGIKLSKSTGIEVS